MSQPEPIPGPSRPRKRNRNPDSFLMSPMKKRPNRIDLTANEKTIALNVYKHLAKSSAIYPRKTEIIKQTAAIMGLSVKTITRILNEYKTEGKVSSAIRTTTKPTIIGNLDDFTLSAIRRKIHQFYFENELPTVDKVLSRVNNDDDLPSFSRSTIYKIMKKLNFKYMKWSRKSVLLDRPDLMVWRRNYLLKIKEYRRENRKIYYTDETWLNEGHTANYVWCDETIENSRQAFLNGLSTGSKNPQKGKRLIILHIGSSDGFLDGGDLIFEAKKSDGDYHGEMDAHNYEKWFEKILTKLEPGSVIVMDNAPYHSRLEERLPNMSWRKADIQAWLQEKNINYSDSDIKAELLIKFNKNLYNKKVVDQMAASKNVIVLRLPPYHCELNPIELIWAQLKSHVGKNNKSFKMSEVKELIKEGLTKIGTVSWTSCINHVIKEEDKMLQLDGLIDSVTDAPTQRLIIHVSESEDSSGSDTSNSNGF